MSESNLLKVDNSSLVGDASTVCSVDEDLDLDALNHICAEISEDLGDGGCDPLCLQTPISHLKKSRSKNKKKIIKKPLEMKGIFWNSNGFADKKNIDSFLI